MTYTWHSYSAHHRLGQCHAGPVPCYAGPVPAHHRLGHRAHRGFGNTPLAPYYGDEYRKKVAHVHASQSVFEPNCTVRTLLSRSRYPLLQLSAPLLQFSVPLLHLSVPLLQFSVPLLQLSVHGAHSACVYRFPFRSLQRTRLAAVRIALCDALYVRANAPAAAESVGPIGPSAALHGWRTQQRTRKRRRFWRVERSWVLT
jgi:hypothetical protein